MVGWKAIIRGTCNQHFCPSQEMSQRHCLLLIFVACIFVADTARTALANVTESGRFNRVCDPARFAKFGLNMKEFPYCNSSLPYHVRAKNLVDQMTLSEKVSQLGDQAFGVARIGRLSTSGGRRRFMVWPMVVMAPSLMMKSQVQRVSPLLYLLRPLSMSHSGKRLGR